MGGWLLALPDAARSEHEAHLPLNEPLVKATNSPLPVEHVAGHLRQGRLLAVLYRISRLSRRARLGKSTAPVVSLSRALIAPF